MNVMHVLIREHYIPYVIMISTFKFIHDQLSIVHYKHTEHHQAKIQLELHIHVQITTPHDLQCLPVVQDRSPGRY